MTAPEYLNLDYQVNTRLAEVVNYIKANNLMPNSTIIWEDLMVNARAALAVERSALIGVEELELCRQLRLQREEQEYKARLARERGRGAFGATYTGD